MSTIYSCDTNILLQSWQRDYPPSVFPGVWALLSRLVESGRLIASTEVQGEIERHHDAVAEWARRHAGMFVPIDEPIQVEVRAILRDHRRLIDTRKNRSGADPWVIALAKTRGAVVLTNEFPNGSLEKPKIPDVCDALGIPYCRLTQLFETEGVTFGG